jgi:hypothetical protein
MAQGKKSETTVPVAEKSVIPKRKPALVFISHDTRDAEVAEAFSKLLSSVSAGVLKSFRSSDKKGRQGIEYGTEWYPEIMKKLDEASDIVCLLTNNSINRPWILYEAGVAKGKLDNPVLGVALGIPLNKATNGPFAQFQNCGDDENSLTALILQLVKRIPDSEPDEEIIKQQVQVFKGRLTEIMDQQPESMADAEELIEDAPIAKLFEEVKVMFQDLPSRIDKRVNIDKYRKRRPRLHPMMIEELLHMGKEFADPNLAFLIMISLFKDDIPWIYEVGLETYRTLRSSKNKLDKQNALKNFDRAIEMLDHPMMQEINDSHEDEKSYMMFKESRHIMHHFFDRYMRREEMIMG